jgi:hypothetical protein
MALSCQAFNLKMDRHFLRPFFDLNNLVKCVVDLIRLAERLDLIINQ